MLRNKEYRLMLLIMSAILIIGAFISFTIETGAGLVFLITGLLLLLISTLYTRRRYEDMERLSAYLRKICTGDYSLDIRDNEEGELSILKNEIYKMTLILSKQAELLKTEKEQLADAISDISHQLKTPLTSMLVMADLLNSDTLHENKRREFTGNLELQLKRMEWLLTSLLKLSKIDSGTIKFKNEYIRVNHLIKQVMKPLLIPMELKEQEFVEEGNSNVSFYGDLNWTVEAMINIVKNCIEHTQVGGEITIKYEENPIYTEIIISDNGKGIAKEDLPFIFKRFYKGKNASEDSVGIGLAMAKSIISNQKGDISVTSHIHQGTSFSVKFYKQIA